MSNYEIPDISEMTNPEFGEGEFYSPNMDDTFNYWELKRRFDETPAEDRLYDDFDYYMYDVFGVDTLGGLAESFQEQDDRAAERQLFARPDGYDLDAEADDLSDLGSDDGDDEWDYDDPFEDDDQTWLDADGREIDLQTMVPRYPYSK